MSSIARAAACTVPRSADEAVDQRIEFVVDGLHPGRGQAIGIGLALVAQRIEARRVDQRRRQAREVVGLERRGARIADVGLAVEIVAAEPFHGGRGSP